MTITAIFFMSVSILAVTILVGWCYYRVLKHPEKRAQISEK